MRCSRGNVWVTYLLDIDTRAANEELMELRFGADFCLV